MNKSIKIPKIKPMKVSSVRSPKIKAIKGLLQKFLK